MKKLLMLLLMIVAPVVCFGQSTLHFTYDDAGNRTSRTIIINNRQSPRHAMDSSKSSLYEDAQVRISNRETNVLHIEILGMQGTANVSVYDSSGKLYVSLDINSSPSDIDISALPNGVYVLRIDSNNKVNTWKLIKK